MKSPKTIIAILPLTAIVANVAGCTSYAITAKVVSANDLMDSISPNNVSSRPADDTFTARMADFAVEIFKKGITDKENSLISPLSVMLALAMAANGADGETLAEMEALLGGGIPLAELNAYLFSYTQMLPNMEKSELPVKRCENR